MRVLDLFSGIGGFSLGLERAGMTTVAFCEKEPFCQQVLAKHWPGVPIHDDVNTLDGAQYRGAVELICGGFPCQPFSRAGKRAGKEDDRDLWPQMSRLVGEILPAWVIGENTPGLGDLALDRCVSDLEGHGYAVQCFDIPACGVGGSHRRHRIFIVANTASDGLEWGWQQKHRAIERTLRSESNRLGEGRRRDGSTAADTRCELLEGRRAEPTQITVEWPTESPLRRTDDGVPRRLDKDRLKALGNAVVPAVVEAIGRAIAEYL